MLLTLVLALESLAASAGWVLRHQLTPTDRSLFIAGALGVALVCPWFFGSLGAHRLAALSVDPSHELVRRSLRSEGSLMLAKLVLPALVSILAAHLVLLTIGTAAGWLTWPTGLHVLLALASYTAVVVTIRVSSIAVRTWISSRVRRGRSGLAGRTVLSVAQVAGAFGAPHVLVRLRDSRDWPAVGEALGHLESATRAPAALALQLALLVVSLALASRIPRMLDAATSALNHENGQVDALMARASALHLMEPGLTPRTALSRVAWARLRRAGGPLTAPALGSITFGLVMAALVLGLQGSGLLFPSGDRSGVTAIHGLSLSVVILLAIEMSSAGIVRFTSPDADRTAMDLIWRIPGAYDAAVRAKAAQHAVLVGIPLVALVALVVVFPQGWTLPTSSASLLVGLMLTMSVVEHVGAAAIHPRRDWATIEEIGQHPRAKVWSLGLTFGAMIVVAPLATALHMTLDRTLTSGALTALALVAGAVALATVGAPRLTSLVVRRWQ
ncbi:hypothetical protein [Nocardioides sp.]|uniref:hypothetical protein n=1 Tax=Nocardioides sp. TaxID=35761 RepID=UPI002BABB4AC|nr:hypothetical protein [Nocardioides sp.]HSX68861.1 hypothetical protein [Nocardioides sp.]